MKKLSTLFAFLFVSAFLTAQEAKPQASAEELAKKLANPIASLISLPLQSNIDLGIGDLNGSRFTINIQPVIPVRLSKNLNLIGRWVQPVVAQYNISDTGSTEVGLGDAVVSAFFSPSNTKGGFTWGAGPVFLVPDGTDDFLTTKKFGIGPTAVALFQSKGFTVGALINQIWSVAGDKSRSDVNQMFFQPFCSYSWKSGAGVGGVFEMTQNREANTTTLWFIPNISAISSLGKQKVQFLIGPRFNLAAPAGSKADFGIRANIVFLFPK